MRRAAQPAEGRFARLTNAISKKLENHVHALALHFMYYNFAKPNLALKGKTPAMASGLADHVWSVEENRRLDRIGRHDD